MVVIIAAGLILRLSLVLTHPGYLGVDGGAYLLSANAVLGDEPTNAGFPRPPLAPGWLLVPFIHFLGTDIGYKVWSALASMFPLLPVFLFTRRMGVAPTLFAAGFLLLDLTHAEMIVTGALPLVAFGLLGTAWWAMSRLVEAWSWRNATVLTVTVGLIPWVNQTTAGLALITIPVFAGVLLWYNRRGAGSQRIPGGDSPDMGRSHIARILSRPSTSVLVRLALPLAVGGIVALGALPWYIQVLPGSGLLHYPGQFLYLAYWNDSAWWQFLLAWPLGLYLICKGDTPPLRTLGVISCLLGTLLVFMSTDETILNVFYRSRYLLAIPFYIGVAWLIYTRWLPALHWKPWAISTVVAIALSVMAFGFLTQFKRQAGYSDMITPASAEALAFIKRTDSTAGIVNNSFTLALWISALNKVPSPHTWTWTPPPTFIATDKDVRCILGWTECDPAAAQERLNVGFVLIEGRFPYYSLRAPAVFGSLNKARPWDNLPQVAWLVPVFSQGTTNVYRIDFAQYR